ncbi:MAG TPA: hypothetical protein PLJ60_09645 [Chryseolinea sp.]|nr:hypothetical protein [Chryseolinea sp.]HPM30586.1 hypothetical protein [Chryseolinea sp.]
MRRLFRVPLIFFFIAACIGLLLRWHFVSPLPWIKFPYWLHTHSHMMFLGWVFNTLFLAYVSNYSLIDKRYKSLFIVMQCLLCVMLISFPLQGYGIVSIIFSTLHTICVAVFCLWILKDFKKTKGSVSIDYGRISLILFLISSLGPFTLGPLMAIGFGQTKWYYFAVYFYLHFQYNGVFIFGLFSLFYHEMEERGIQFNRVAAEKSKRLLWIAIFPTYFLSTLWADPGLLFNIIGFIGAIIQIISLYCFIQVIRPLKFEPTYPKNKVLLLIAFFSLILKSILQLVSAHPQIAHLAFDIRSFIIAYLHLVLIGVITLFLLGWYIEKNVVEIKSSASIYFIVIGFVGSELVMVLMGTSFFQFLSFTSPPVLLFLFSIVIVWGLGSFLLCSFRKIKNT